MLRSLTEAEVVDWLAATLQQTRELESRRRALVQELRLRVGPHPPAEVEGRVHSLRCVRVPHAIIHHKRGLLDALHAMGIADRAQQSSNGRLGRFLEEEPHYAPRLETWVEPGHYLSFCSLNFGRA